MQRAFQVGDMVRVIHPSRGIDIGDSYEVGDVSYTIKEKHAEGCRRVGCAGQCFRPSQSEPRPLVYLIGPFQWYYEQYFVLETAERSAQ